MRSKLEPLGEAQGLGDRLGVLGEARRHRRRRGQRRAAVAAPPRLGLLQRLAQPDRDEGVLQAGAAAGVGVDVAGRHAGDAEPLGEPGEPAVAGAVVAPVGPLQLDPEALAAEGAEQAPAEPLAARRVAPLPGAGERPVAGAAGEADQPLGVLLQLLQRRRRLPGACAPVLSRVWAWAAVSSRQRLRYPAASLDQQGEVGERRARPAPMRRRSAPRR